MSSDQLPVNSDQLLVTPHQQRAGRDAPSLQIHIGPLCLRNPVMTASGTCGYGEELAEFVPLDKLGAIVTKTVTRHPREGNPPPRVCETAAGMLNAIGLQNVGIERFISDKLPFLRDAGATVIANIAGEDVAEFAELARRLDGVGGVAAIELNLSCPNVAGGLDFSTDPQLTEATCAAVKAATRLPVIAKLSPNVTDIVAIARAAVAGGADAVSLINTLVGMAIDVKTRRPKLANVTGGLSGPAIKPVALRMVYQVAQAVSVPVIGIGGIMTAEDALEFLLAGASAVQVGTATFTNPRVSLDVLEGIERWMQENGMGSVQEIVGGLRLAEHVPTLAR
ncbi:MAG: dihydroorotate dehydrogenase [Abditibacteriales bacterium]|nr:dihydroorotate dehydrogenase [Abditibacteriales bacterium]MDW8364646.1 dihydroorotate dehydrogenase [Abditibacteriales bacterium]